MYLLIFDLVLVCEGSDIMQVFVNMLDLVQYVEGWGYYCYWLVEYYNMFGIVSVVMVVLIGYVVGGIWCICVGVGGIMLFNYLFLQVVEQFGMLVLLYLDCIDFGLGCVLGIDQLIVCVLCCYFDSVDQFLQDVCELFYYFQLVQFGQVVCVVFGVGILVLVWLFGFSLFSVCLVVVMGLLFVFVLYFVLDVMDEVLVVYCCEFCCFEYFDVFYVVLGLNVVVVDLEVEVKCLFIIQQQSFVNLCCGRLGLILLLIDDIEDFWQLYEKFGVENVLVCVVVGDLDQVCEGMVVFVVWYRLDELLFIVNIYDYVVCRCLFGLVMQVYCDGSVMLQGVFL